VTPGEHAIVVGTRPTFALHARRNRTAVLHFTSANRPPQVAWHDSPEIRSASLVRSESRNP
jgi:hypothetical protein